jgi:hypothetical protein
MAVTEQQRHRLRAWFEEHMGPDLGGTMMDLLRPADASALATKADLAELRAEVKADLLQLQRTLGTWLFASQAAVIAVVGVLVAVLAAVT